MKTVSKNIYLCPTNTAFRTLISVPNYYSDTQSLILTNGFHISSQQILRKKKDLGFPASKLKYEIS